MTAGPPARAERAGGRRRPRKQPLLPQQHPLAMPDQCLSRTPASAMTWPARDAITPARAAILAAWFTMTALFAERLHAVVAVPAMTPLQAVFLVLSVLSFAWVAFGTTLFVAGFLELAQGRSGDTLDHRRGMEPAPGRTALLFPVHHEDMAEIAATVAALADDPDMAPIAARCDVFILSDSRTEVAELTETAAAERLAALLAGRLAVFYRRRSDNAGRKAGNVRDWIERFGGAYDTFIVFDADSRMTASTLHVLMSAMAARPAAGLIQTVPRLEPGLTLLSRLSAFAAAVQGPVSAAGLAVWQREAGNYWGHNAIVRTRAFAAAAGLPPLSGSPPFGGTILSHDFVEAALLRRAGYEVHLVPGLGGSTEGSPPGLGELTARDRRWAQGNLQHLRLLMVPGLPWVSRVHLAVGAAAYLAAAFWAATLVVGLVLALQARVLVPTYFGSEPSLFPEWPRFDPEAALPLLGWTVAVVFLPKLLGFAHALRHVPVRVRSPLVAGAVIETIASALIAPLLMASQTRAVIEILARRDSGWGKQRRSGEPPSWRQALFAHAGKSLTGIALLAATTAISWPLALWTAPVWIGLALAPLLDWVTARPVPLRLAVWLTPPGLVDDATAFRREAHAVHWRAMLGPAGSEGGR